MMTSQVKTYHSLKTRFFWHYNILITSVTLYLLKRTLQNTILTWKVKMQSHIFSRSHSYWAILEGKDVNRSMVGWRHLYLLLRANCAHLVISKKSPPPNKIIIQDFLHVRNIPVNLPFSSNSKTEAQRKTIIFFFSQDWRIQITALMEYQDKGDNIWPSQIS